MDERPKTVKATRKTKKLLAARVGGASLTLAFCALLPGCNLAVSPVPRCYGDNPEPGCPVDARANDTAAGDGSTSDATGSEGP